MVVQRVPSREKRHWSRGNPYAVTRPVNFCGVPPKELSICRLADFVVCQPLPIVSNSSEAMVSAGQSQCTTPPALGFMWRQLCEWIHDCTQHSMGYFYSPQGVISSGNASKLSSGWCVALVV